MEQNSMKINEIVRLSDAFAAEVNVLRDYSYRSPEGNEEKIKGYLPNKSSRDIIKSILSSCPESTDKKLHLITASYGTGKSYLLLMLANLLANQDKVALASLIEKVHDKEEYYKDKLSSAIDNHVENSAPFLVVIPEYGDSDFNHALLEGLKFALQKNNIEYIPRTNYEEAIKAINHWELKTPQNYLLLKEYITNSTVENFIEQLHAYNPAAYSEFKRYFKEIIGSPFAESHTSAYPVFADTAKEIRKFGFRGIAIIYDEFGEMLGKLINSSSSATGTSVQDFLENVKAKKENCNIVFVSASHQDPQTLKASKEKELNKVIGRFEKHHLIVSEAEGEEIIGAIFIKENQKEFENIYEHSLFQEHLKTILNFRLYPDKDKTWIETKILRNLFPLHPLTSYILPRLSHEFAQNTRSMFNFLSPTETKEGAFRYFLNNTDIYTDQKLNLFTPDLLVDFFLKNIREGKEASIQALYDVYRTSIGKVIDQHHQSIMKNLFMLWVVNMSTIRPTKETLFWAMNWEESRRKEFYHLLDDLVSTLEYLELNPTDNNYQFPDFGAAPLSKVIDEEVKKLDELTLAQCLKTWEDIIPLEGYPLRDHNTKYGCNRLMYVEAVEDPGRVISSIKELESYYNNSFQYFANGLIFYLIGSSEDEIEDLKNAINRKETMLPYIVFATPNNLPQLDALRRETLQYRAIVNTAARPDIMQNPARAKSIQDQLQMITRKLEEKLKDLFEPSNWKWNYKQEQDVELTSKPKLSNWINSKIDLLFSDTPTIKDEALWFTEGNKGAKDRKQALNILLYSEKDRIPLRDENNNAADRRIIRNFFALIGLTTDKKRDKNIQYGEIKLPDQESQVYRAWKLIDTKLKAGSYIDPSNIILPLLQEPFGLSEHIIKFLLAAYIRYDIERVVIADARRRIVQSLSLELIENLINKPWDYLVRKIEMTGPELRYLGQLKTLFDKQDVNTWMDITQKFIGIVQYQTPLHKGIIQDSGDSSLQAFYRSLETLKSEFQSTGSDKEKLSQDYFQEHLPTLLLNEGRPFMEDQSKVDLLINKLETHKKYPSLKESERKIEVIQALSEEVFGINIINKSEITGVVQKWFKGLPSPNQNGKFSNEIIKNWILEIKLGTTSDPFELYLDKLTEKPFKDWENFSYEKHRFISRFIEYKKTVEDYTKSPLDVLQIIARGVFEKSASECCNEQEFDNFFKNWWLELPGIYKAEHYSRQTNLLISQISLPSAVKARYLETIPQVWKEAGYLPAYIPKEWESWSNQDTYKVAEKYHACIQEVTNWKPPVEEIEVFNSLGKLFTDREITTLSCLYTVIKEWYEELPIRTKNANWEAINEYAATFMTVLCDGSSFYEFIIEELPALWKFNEFKKWNHAILETYTAKFQTLKDKIENYKRPICEIIEKIEEKTKEKSSSPEAFCLNLNLKVKDSEAFRNKVDPQVFESPISTLVYEAVRKNNLNLTSIISSISTELKVADNWHLWSEKDEKAFIAGFKKGVDNLTKWKFPEAEKLKKAKIKVKAAVLTLQKDLELDDQQMRKVLNDILEGK
jgi:hypothetical protein